MPKCVICGKQLDKNEAYQFIHVSKTGKEYKKWACSEEEVENDKRDKELFRLCQYATDEILNRPITNNVRNKELTELHETGYSWEQIYRCIKANAQHIKDMISMNHIENDYQQIRYMMQVIKNTIFDHAREDAKVNDWERYKQVEEVSEEEFSETKEESEDEILKRLKNKKENTNNISSFLNNLK